MSTEPGDDGQAVETRDASASRPLVAWGVALACIAFALSGFYSLGSDEEGLVLRFGRLVRQDGAGLHYHLPYPVETVLRVRSRMVRSISLDEKGKQNLRLTGDENILNIKALVQFAIKDPRAYAFLVDSPDDVMQSVLSSVIVEIVATRTVDDVLTTGKTEMQTLARARAQERLDLLGAGINLISVNVTESSPPDPVVEAFNDVASAREDANKYKHEAEAYANGLFPAARGEAQQALQLAEGDRAARVQRAKGDASHFQSVLAEYVKAPSLTRRRMLLETMETILPAMKKFVAHKGSATLIFEDLDY